jgi:hypothetical protein
MRTLFTSVAVIGLMAIGNPARSAAPVIADTQITAGVVVSILPLIALGKALSKAVSNDNHPADHLQWFGFQMMGSCEEAGGHSTVPGGAGLPCYDNNEFPLFGAGLQILTGLTQNECDAKALNGAAAIRGTNVPVIQALGQSGVPFGPRPELNNMSPGGICDGGGTYRFVGWMRDGYHLGYPNGLSKVACAFAVNMCAGLCSCDGYSQN